MHTRSLPWIQIHGGLSYDRITFHQKFEKGGRKFLVAIYGAYTDQDGQDASRNGIALFDEDLGTVLLDEHERAAAGFWGPSEEQTNEAKRILDMRWGEFRDFVNAHPRARRRLDS